MKKYLEAGRLTSQRGIKGELRFECWCDSPEFLSRVKRFYLSPEGGTPHAVAVYRASIPSIIFEGCDSREASVKYIGKTIYFDRDDVVLPEGSFFNDDLIGLPAFDYLTGEKLGVLTSIDTNGYRPLYTVEGEKKYLIPLVDEFVKEISLESGLKIKLIDGLEL